MLKKIVVPLTVLVLLGTSLICKKSENNESQTALVKIKESQEVSLDFDVYNHTQGYLKSLSHRAVPGSIFRLLISDLGVSDVDERRIVVREKLMGERVAYSRTGECEFSVPERDMAYSVYLMNTSNNAEYRAVDVRVGIYEGNLQFPREMKWSTEDRNGFQGPEEPIAEAIRQLDAALDYPWARYGRFVKIDTKNGAHFTVGYGECRDQYGWHTLRWTGVNPIHCYNHKLKLETFLEEIFELVTGTENIAEKDTVSMIADNKTGSLNGIGRDLLAYIFVKDVM